MRNAAKSTTSAGMRGEIRAATARAARRRTRLVPRGFTLIELLIVIALSGLLLALLFAPIVQGFKITNRTKALVQAQDATRFGLENMEREIGEAAYVFDNTNTTITLPLEPAATYPKRTQNGSAIYSAATIAVGYGRLDLVPVDLNGTTSGTTAAIDPTTGTPVGGATTRVPGAASSNRYVRYFIALRNPRKTYTNVYVFPHSGIDNDINPFILYRAEYDPHNANLIKQISYTNNGQTVTVPDMTNPTADSGTFGDPDFFYNGPYAANWQAIASPVVSGTNLDMLVWQKGSNGQYVPGSSFRLATSFAPATVVGDTATPGFLSLANADAMGAVPTLYTAKNGQWTLPFTINIYRGVGISNATGSLALNFAYPSTGGALAVNASGTGVFANVTSSNVYCFYSPGTGRYFVTTPGLQAGIAFWIDPARGRIETGIPPIGAQGGSPQVYTYDSNGALNTAMLTTPVAGTIQPYELATTIFRSTTLDVSDANQPVVDATSGKTFYVPSNQGLLFADLRNPVGYGTTGGSPPGYYETTRSPFRMDQIGAASLSSPFASFDGSILAPGTEHVVGPDNNLSTTYSATGMLSNGNVKAQLFNYFRVSDTTDAGGVNTLPPTSTPGLLYNRSGALSYRFDPDFKYTSYPKIDFGVSQIDYTMTPGSTTFENFLVKYGYAGLPALPAMVGGASATATSTAQSLAEIQISFLWQNNFARDGNGYPLSPDGTIAKAENGGAVTPQPDVFRLDYATRALMNVSLGAAVYDSSGGQPQVAQISDKVKINNVGH